MNQNATTLRIVVLTRTGRSSGQRLAEVVCHTRHTLCSVLAEKRSAMWRKTLKRRGIVGALKHYGLPTILARIRENAAKQRDQKPADDLPVTVVTSLNSDQTVTLLDQYRPDVIVIANAPVIAHKVLNTAQLCAVNFHSGRLPDYGGVASEYWAIHNGETKAWATLHRATEKLDSGEILAEEPVEIRPGDSQETLHARLLEKAATMLPPLLDALADHGVRPIRSPGPATLHPWP